MPSYSTVVEILYRDDWLAASGLKFVHPFTGRNVTLQAPVDAEFQGVLAARGWDRGCS